jgi:hypothetical protein
MPEALDLYRAAVTLVAVAGSAMNVAFAVAVVRHRALVPHLPVAVGYPALVGVTATVSAYWRLRDGATGIPANAGDVTALIPSVGAFLMGVLAWRYLGVVVGAAQIKGRL